MKPKDLKTLAEKHALPPSFPPDVVTKLAVDEFIALETAEQRQQWAIDNGVNRILSAALVDHVRAHHRKQKTR